MSGTGYYREELVPPEYRGQTWEQRAPNTDGGSIQSPFPPVAVGNPAEPFPPFSDFQGHQGLLIRAENPSYYCPGECGRFSTPPICPVTACLSARCEPIGRPTDDGTERDHRCLTCGTSFLALLLCEPCRGDRGAVARPKTSSPVRTPARRQSDTSQRRRIA